MKTTLTVAQNRVITMQYSLTNAAGTVLREASSRPVSYLHGSGTLPPRLEQKLESRQVGDIVSVRLLPEDAFGKRDIELVCDVPLDEFPESETIEVDGHVVGTDADGRETSFTVTAIKDGIISLDGNHPLAGQTLIFEVEIQAIREATAEEVRTGKV